MTNLWRPEGWANPYPEKAEPDNSLSDKLMYARIVYEAGADAMLEALWELARVSPTGTFTIDTRCIYAYGGVI